MSAEGRAGRGCPPFPPPPLPAPADDEPCPFEWPVLDRGPERRPLLDGGGLFSGLEGISISRVMKVDPPGGAMVECSDGWTRGRRRSELKTKGRKGGGSSAAG